MKDEKLCSCGFPQSFPVPHEHDGPATRLHKSEVAFAIAAEDFATSMIPLLMAASRVGGTDKAIAILKAVAGADHHDLEASLAFYEGMGTTMEEFFRAILGARR